MPLFFHDQFLFGDEAGFAQYRQEHWYEHVQFVQIGQAQSPVILIPDFDLTSWANDQSFATNWLTTHESVHEILRFYTGVTGINLADVNLENESEFYTWDNLCSEGAELFKQHFTEVAMYQDLLRLKPNHEFYRTMEKSAALRVITARCDGLLIGYLIMWIHPHPHYHDTVCAYEDAKFVLPEYRGHTGAKLVRFAEGVARDAGATMELVAGYEGYERLPARR